LEPTAHTGSKPSQIHLESNLGLKASSQLGDFQRKNFGRMTPLSFPCSKPRGGHLGKVFPLKNPKALKPTAHTGNKPSQVHLASQIYLCLAFGRAILEPLGGLGGGQKQIYQINVFFCGFGRAILEPLGVVGQVYN